MRKRTNAREEEEEEESERARRRDEGGEDREISGRVKRRDAAADSVIGLCSSDCSEMEREIGEEARSSAHRSDGAGFAPLAITLACLGAMHTLGHTLVHAHTHTHAHPGACMQAAAGEHLCYVTPAQAGPEALSDVPIRGRSLEPVQLRLLLNSTSRTVALIEKGCYQ